MLTPLVPATYGDRCAAARDEHPFYWAHIACAFAVPATADDAMAIRLPMEPTTSTSWGRGWMTLMAQACGRATTSTPMARIASGTIRRAASVQVAVTPSCSSTAWSAATLVRTATGTTVMQPTLCCHLRHSASARSHGLITHRTRRPVAMGGSSVAAAGTTCTCRRAAHGHVHTFGRVAIDGYNSLDEAADPYGCAWPALPLCN